MIQTIEERFKDRFFAGGGGDNTRDYFLMSGASESSQLCICPALSSYVADEARKEVAVLKERRKAREERSLLKPAPKKGGKDNEG